MLKSSKKLYRKEVFIELGVIEYFFDDFGIVCETDMKGREIYWYLIPYKYNSKEQRKIEEVFHDKHPDTVTSEMLSLFYLSIADI